jgi:hypothetical protein
MSIHEIIEQEAVFDGATPHFYVDGAALMGLLNHLAWGSIEDAKADMAKDPRKFLVRVRIEFEEV